MKKNRTRTAIGLALVLLLLAHVQGAFVRVPFIDTLETIIYDARLRLTMPRTRDPRIVILDLDEKSLAERERGGEGHWPWPRDRLAVLLDTLFGHYGVAVVGFDIVFSERDESSGVRVLERLAQDELRSLPQFRAALERLKPELDYDALFARSMRNRPVVLGYTFSHVDQAIGAIPPPVLTDAEFGAHPPYFEAFSGYTGNLSQFMDSAASAGHFNPAPDEDGLHRRVPMLARFGTGYYEPLSVAVVRLINGSPAVKVDIAYAGDSYSDIDAVRIGHYAIPVDSEGAALVPFRGKQESFAYHSLIDVLNARVPVGELRGKIALVGTTAPGLFDLRATPVDPVFPGVEIHANMISGILDGNIKHRPPYARGAEFVLVLVFGLALAVWLPGLTPHRASVSTATVLLLALGVNVWFFQFEHIVLPLASQLVLIVLLFTLNMAYGFFVEARSRREITGLFGQYVPPEVVDELANEPEKASMEGESREMTVLFTDVRGFTTISEGLDPRTLKQLMNEFLTPLTEVIYRHRGTIDKYMGDCIMAFWGAPLPDTSHARNGVAAALEMQRTLAGMQTAFRAKDWPEIRIGVGLNSGRMSVGNMGSQLRLAYTVMGDAVNLASRLEGLTKEYGADIIVGEETKKAAPEVAFRELDRVRVKGRDTAVAIFEPLGLRESVETAKLHETDLFHEALQLYRKQEWQMAEQRLLGLKRLQPQSQLYDLFLERIAFLRVNPPAPDWDGAFTFQTK